MKIHFDASMQKFCIVAETLEEGLAVVDYLTKNGSMPVSPKELTDPQATTVPVAVKRRKYKLRRTSGKRRGTRRTWTTEEISRLLSIISMPTREIMNDQMLRERHTDKAIQLRALTMRRKYMPKRGKSFQVPSQYLPDIKDLPPVQPTVN